MRACSDFLFAFKAFKYDSQPEKITEFYFKYRPQVVKTIVYWFFIFFAIHKNIIEAYCNKKLLENMFFIVQNNFNIR